MFASYMEYTRGGALKAFLRLKKGNAAGNTYDAIFADVGKRLYFFGRYSNFMYLETIYNLTKFPMWPTGLNLREARTSRNGLCYALGREDWVRKSGKAAKLTKEQFAYLQAQLRRLYEEIRKDAPDVPTTATPVIILTGKCRRSRRWKSSLQTAQIGISYGSSGGSILTRARWVRCRATKA